MTYAFDASGKLLSATSDELKAADGNSALIVRCYGNTADDKAFWCFLAVKPSKYKAFVEATTAHKSITFGEYGEILKYGFATEVPTDVQEEMKNLYDWDDNYLQNALDEMRKQREAFLQKQEEIRIHEIVAMLKKKE